MDALRRYLSKILVCLVGIVVGPPLTAIGCITAVECESFDVEEVEEAVRGEFRTVRASSGKHMARFNRQPRRNSSQINVTRVPAGMRCEHATRNGFGGPMTS